MCFEHGVDSDREVWRGGWRWTVLPKKVTYELVLTSPHGISELLYIHSKTRHVLEKQISTE